MSRYAVPAVRAVQNGREVFSFFLPAHILAKIKVDVEKFDSNRDYDDPEQGYQRNAENNRARRFSRYLEKADALSPTALMLNDRHSQTEWNTRTNTLSIDPETALYNYDGQHRQLGYQFRLEEDEAFANFPIPVIMTRGMDKVTEMLQFQTINSTAKGVATSLVNAILAKLQATEGDAAIGPSQERPVVCFKATEAIAKDPESPWHLMIAMPNEKLWTNKQKAEDPKREHTRIINASSFIDALRPVHDYLHTQMMAATIDERSERIASVLNEFWSALKEKMPEAFNAPSEYSLFRSSGVGPVHMVLRDLLTKMHLGRREYVKEQFLAMLDGCGSLSNPEFWQADNDDGARIYSGKATWPMLAKIILREMEEVKAS